MLESAGRSLTSANRYHVQWIPRFKSAQDKSIRDLRAAKSACSAYAKIRVFPTTDKEQCAINAFTTGTPFLGQVTYLKRV